MTTTDATPAEASPSDSPPSAAAPAAARPSPRGGGGRVRLWRLGLGVLGSLVLALVVMLGGILGTQHGLRAAFAVVEDLAPGLLKVERVEGRVLGRLTLAGLDLRLGELRISLGRLDLDWSPLALFGSRLAVAELILNDLDLVLPPGSDTPAEPLVLPDLALPIDVEIKHVRVEPLRLFNLGGTAPFLTLSHGDLAARLSAGELALDHLEVALVEPKLAVRAGGQATLRDQYPLTLALAWSLEQAPALSLQGVADARGDLSRLVIQHRLSGSARADLNVEVSDPLDRLAWDGRLEISGIDLPDLDPELPEVSVTGSLRTEGDLERAAVTGSLAAEAPDLPDFGQLAAVLDLLWSDQTLELRALELTEQVSAAQLSATGRLALGSAPGDLELNAQWQQLRWPLSGELVAQSPSGKLEVLGRLDELSFVAALSARAPDLPPLELSLDGEGGPTQVRIDTLLIEVLQGELRGSGEVGWVPELTWSLDLKGRDLDPGQLVEGLDDRLDLTLTSAGGLGDFSYALSARSVGPGLPPSALSIAGQGDQRETRIDTLALETLGGRIAGTARVGWDPQLSWEAALDAADLNPGTYVADWPGRIGARLTSRGTLGEAGPDLTAVIERLAGELRGYPIQAGGTLTMKGEQIRIDDLNAASGPSRLTVNGLIEERLDLAFTLESPDLASLAPAARGSLSLSGDVTGPRQSPRVKVDLSAREAGWAGQGLASLSGQLDLGIAPDDPFKIRLDGQGLAVGDLNWTSLSLRGDGRIPEHRLELVLQGEPLGLTLAGAGGLDDAGAYRGQIGRLDLRSSAFGDWGLRRPAEIEIAGPRLAAGPLCLRGPRDAGGCLELDQTTTGQWRSNLDLTLTDLGLLAPVLPEALAIEGNARLEARLQAADSILSGRAAVELPRGLLRIQRGKGGDQRLDLSGTRLGLDASARALAARLDLPLAELGRLDGSLSLPGWRLDAPARPGQPLTGSLRGTLTGLERIAELVPDVTGVTGRIDLDLALGGTLGAPGARGEARVSQVAFEVPLVGLKVLELNLTATAPAYDRVDLVGEAKLGGGRLEISGDARHGGEALAARVRVSGTRLKVADTREYFALVSPDLSLEASSREARLSGVISIPEARIRPRSLPAGTKTAASDVVLQDQDPRRPFPLSIDLRLKFGDDVTIDAFGVRGRVAGELALLQSPGREMLGEGQLQITDGQYRLSSGFGIAADLAAPLDIVQGRLVFARSPIGNPGLLLQAERAGGSTSAGVRVLGTLRDPKLAFFSESDPGMTQAEVTKFLLTGVAPSRDDQGPTAGLAVGTYIAPKIFLEYESGLGDQPNKVRMRYDLTNRVEVQTETGGSQGGDIFFTFER